ncbi:CPBP family intramembrane glutamic endopeptidase [Streptomyces erythrochromogenes]|uniref:CPBP family intramembrane glutamic endopeptidase n=1 Tax=Streptomyces erythrochromogenes TaxID=285574 RepID=UPI0034007C97
MTHTPTAGTAPDSQASAADASRTAAVLAVTAVILTGLPIVIPWLYRHPLPLVLYVLLLAAVTAGVLLTGSRPATRVVLTADLVLGITLVTGLAAWPAPLGIAVLVFLVSGRLPLFRQGREWLRLGVINRQVVWLTVATVAVSGTALTTWAWLTDPSGGTYLTSLQKQPLLVGLLGILAFSLVNSFCEEAVFRGIFQTELTPLIGALPAITVQAVSFGLLHITGFPSGVVGALLAGVYGLLLGFVRERSQGMAAPYVAHVCADMTIGLLVLTAL